MRSLILWFVTVFHSIQQFYYSISLWNLPFLRMNFCCFETVSGIGPVIAHLTFNHEVFMFEHFICSVVSSFGATY